VLLFTPSDGPMPETDGDITRLLQEWRSGDSEAEHELFALVFPDLRRLAHYFMQRERKGHTLQATELVDQIYFRLVAAKNQDWRNRQHFFAIAARAMRRYLIDHARGRPDADFIGLEGIQKFFPAAGAKIDTVLMLDRLMDQLAAAHPDWCTVVEMKYFLGLTDVEAAEMTGLTVRTMQRRWRDARQWLFERMDAGDAGKSAGR
jgi:RNA polymerase sigma-70 factor (ECF subfamily)